MSMFSHFAYADGHRVGNATCTYCDCNKIRALRGLLLEHTLGNFGGDWGTVLVPISTLFHPSLRLIWGQDVYRDRKEKVEFGNKAVL